MRIDVLRQRAFAAGVAMSVAPALEVFEMEEWMDRNNTLGQLNIELFSELHRLREVDVSDTDKLRAEIERSKAVEGISHTIIDNAKMVLDATRMRAEFTCETNVPRMLEG